MDESRGDNVKYISNKYTSEVYESSSMPRKSLGEYSYGKGGTSFGKSIKRSKFDEDKQMIYSPGPGRYESNSSDTSAVFSFSKQKKDITFAKTSSKDIPSPGKYKIKRDFLSKSFKKNSN